MHNYNDNQLLQRRKLIIALEKIKLESVGQSYPVNKL